MVTSPGPAARKFGAEVRRSREQAGISQNYLAASIPTSQTNLSDIELGKRSVKKDMAERLDQLLTSQGRLIAAWEAFTKSYDPPEWYQKLSLLEPRATEIEDYQPLLIPGLLQTRSYIRATIRASNRIALEDEVEAKVAERIERQEILKEPTAPFLLAVVDEMALYRRMGTREVMGHQLGYLGSVAEWERVEILVVPKDTWNHPGLDSGFRLLRSPDTGTVLYQETRAGGGVIVDPETVEDHASLLGMLRSVALPPEQSQAAIAKAQGEFT